MSNSVVLEASMNILRSAAILNVAERHFQSDTHLLACFTISKSNSFLWDQTKNPTCRTVLLKLILQDFFFN